VGSGTEICIGKLIENNKLKSVGIDKSEAVDRGGLVDSGLADRQRRDLLRACLTWIN
jgi:hypothetical protein